MIKNRNKSNIIYRLFIKYWLIFCKIASKIAFKLLKLEFCKYLIV